MAMFSPENRDKTARHRRLYAYFEVWYTIVDFGAAFAFVIGSVLFFFDTTQIPATWFFLVGSLLFAAKPSIRLARELRYLRMGDYETLAKRELS